MRHAGKDADECGADRKTVGHVGIVDRVVRQPEGIIEESQSEHNDRDSLHTAGYNGDDGGTLDKVEGSSSLSDPRIVAARGPVPDLDEEDQTKEFDHNADRHEDLNDDEPRRHDPASDLVELRRKDPPAAMIGLHLRVIRNSIASETYLPKPYLPKARIYARP